MGFLFSPRSVWSQSDTGQERGNRRRGRDGQLFCPRGKAPSTVHNWKTRTTHKQFKAKKKKKNRMTRILCCWNSQWRSRTILYTSSARPASSLRPTWSTREPSGVNWSPWQVRVLPSFLKINFSGLLVGGGEKGPRIPEAGRGLLGWAAVLKTVLNYLKIMFIV